MIMSLGQSAINRIGQASYTSNSVICALFEIIQPRNSVLYVNNNGYMFIVFPCIDIGTIASYL